MKLQDNNFQPSSNWNRGFILLMAATFIFLTGFDWPQFRGPGGQSVSSEKVPVKFSDTESVAWKTDLPAKGASSPIVFGDRIIVTCSGGDDQEQLYCCSLDANSGQIQWTQKFWATGRTLCHPLSSNAAPTPATDGKHIFAFYSSNDLACLDMDGNLIWFRGLAVDYPKAGNDVGMSASPVVKDGVVVVLVESQGASFAMGLDVANGKTLWTNEREKVGTWTSPVVTSDAAASQPQVVIQSANRMSILDLKTGEVVKDFEGDGSSVPSPIIADDLLLAPMDGMTAYKYSGGKAEKIWNSPRIKPGSASGIVYKDKVMAVHGGGVLNIFNLSDGEPAGKVRVGGSHWATPVVAGEHMYFFAQDGTAKVVELSDEPKVVHEHKFEDEVFLGSPAVSNGALYFRSDKSIWKVSDKSGPTT